MLNSSISITSWAWPIIPSTFLTVYGTSDEMMKQDFDKQDFDKKVSHLLSLISHKRCAL